MKKIPLQKFDNQMEKHNDKFPKIEDEKKDLYQKRANCYLKYFYIRNNIYIERLNDNQKQYLLNLHNNGDINLSLENEKFIDETYEKIIIEYPNEKNVVVSYGPDNIKYYKPNNAIIIGIRYDEIFLMMNDDENLSNSSQSKGILSFTIPIWENEVKKCFNKPFAFVQYNDFSVKKNSNIDIEKENRFIEK